ncbi:MAG: hypothetical protein ACLFTR_02015 [Candidatus Woesearchaeota archaeon]
MKFPKEVKRLCSHCKKHTPHKVTQAKAKTFNSVHTLSKGSKPRMRARQEGKNVGTGNSGKTSRPPVKKRKMSGKKLSKLTDLRYQCTECKKSSVQSGGVRSKKVEFV